MIFLYLEMCYLERDIPNVSLIDEGNIILHHVIDTDNEYGVGIFWEVDKGDACMIRDNEGTES